MIIPGVITTYYMLYLRNFFMTIPVELYESASLDGCSEVGILIRIILPLSLPALATFVLFYAVDHWNEFYSGIIYISDYKKQPLQVYLRQVLYDATVQSDPEEMQKLLGNGEMKFQPPSEAMKAAVVIAATLPILCVYPFLQKYFVKGMLMGSLKG
jgi:putative aldouronate transport system permease protein